MRPAAAEAADLLEMTRKWSGLDREAMAETSGSRRSRLSMMQSRRRGGRGGRGSEPAAGREGNMKGERRRLMDEESEWRVVEEECACVKRVTTGYRPRRK